MSRASSVPAPIVAKSAPWMNGTARANARNESVGNPGRSVDGSRPAELTSINATGKTSGGIAIAGWRSVRRIERPATAPIWTAARLTACEPPAGMRTGSRLRPRLGRPFERPAGLGEEHVVQARSPELDVVELDPFRIEPADDIGETDP